MTKGDYINKLIELVTQKSRLETYELMCDHISGEDYGFKSANIELHDIEENIADIVQILKRWEGK